MNDEQRAMLDTIEGSHGHDIKTCCTEMFNYWLRVDTKASWNKLIEALEMIDEIALAEKIKIDILKGIHICKCAYSIRI